MMARLFWRLALAAALLPVAGCEVGYGLGPDRAWLQSGLYLYEAWSHHGGRDAAWWGYLELRVDHDGAVYGSYRLPDQCQDDFGYLVDCVGRVGGRVYRDGTLRFGLDEGWLANRGEVRYGDFASGRWNSRLLGYRDGGRFELTAR